GGPSTSALRARRPAGITRRIAGVPSRVVRRIRRLLARFACVLRCLPACLERCVRVGFASLPLRGSLAEGEAGHQRACKGFVAPLSGGAHVELAATLHDSAVKVGGFLARLPRDRKSTRLNSSHRTI